MTYGRKPKRPKDENQLAKSIVDIATGKVEDNSTIKPEESVYLDDDDFQSRSEGCSGAEE